MKKLTIFLSTLLLCLPVAQALHASTSSSGVGQTKAANVPSMPSSEEIDELLNKATEYVSTYQRTFTQVKPLLSKADPDFYEGSDPSDSAKAVIVISSMKKNGASAYGLVSLISILDDMSLNASRATLHLAIHGIKEGSSNTTTSLVDIAQAGKNCSDISELLLHATLRLIAVEETVLKSVSDSQSHH